MTAAAITFVRQSREREVTVHYRGWRQARRVSRHTGLAGNRPRRAGDHRGPKYPPWG